MSMFLCAKCNELRDSDSGCEEAPSPPYHPPYQLLCLDCAFEEPKLRGAFTAEQQTIIDAHMAEDDGEGP